MTPQRVEPRNKLIKLIKIMRRKQTHKTHKFILSERARVSTEKQTHKTHETRRGSTGNELIKLMIGTGKNQTHEFGIGALLPDEVSARYGESSLADPEFNEFPSAYTREENQYCRDLKHVHKGTAGKLIELVKLIRPAGAV